jgi:hypothetical protein
MGFFRRNVQKPEIRIASWRHSVRALAHIAAATRPVPCFPHCQPCNSGEFDRPRGATYVRCRTDSAEKRAKAYQEGIRDHGRAPNRVSFAVPLGDARNRIGRIEYHARIDSPFTTRNAMQPNRPQRLLATDAAPTSAARQGVGTPNQTDVVLHDFGEKRCVP